MNQPHRVTYKNYAGISLTGSTKWDPQTINFTKHLDKATWLTAAVEVGAVFGTVQSYDGAGISCGIDQKIALFPKTMQQGELWTFLLKIENGIPATNPHLVAVLNGLTSAGWYLDTRGVLRHKATGTPVVGAELRNEFSPPGGVVPETGPDYNRAVHWAVLWNALLEDPVTFPVQIRETKNDLLNSQKDLESQVYKRFCSIDDASAAVVGTNISPELDLAMCVYHSFSVNAPGRARTVLQEVLGRGLGALDFSKALVKALGINSYGNWRERYTRTRAKVVSSGLFNGTTVLNICPATLA
jgi:hypothetical protein